MVRNKLIIHLWITLLRLSSVVCEADPQGLLNGALVLWLPVVTHPWETPADQRTGEEGSLNLYSPGTLFTEEL